MWEINPLSVLCDVLDSRRKPITKKDRSPGPYPYYGATGILDYVEGYLFDEKLVLIGEDGAKWGAGDNSAFSIDGKTWVNNHAHVIRPKRNKVLDKWLIYYLNGEDLSDFITGMTVPKLNQGKLREIPIPLPPIPEQQRIVAILDQAFADIENARANAEKNLKNARELFDSYLNQVFSQRGEGWVETTLSKACSFSQGMQVGVKNQFDNDSKNRIRFLRIVDFTQGDHEPRYIDFPGDRYSVLEGDVSLVRYGASAGFVCTGLMGVIANNLFKVSPRSEAFTTKYLYYFLCSTVFQAPIQRVIGGAAMPALSFGMINDLDFSYPDIADQIRIINKIEKLSQKIKALETIYSKKLSELETLKKSLLQKAFSGELTKSKGMAA